jgi:3-deoxy-D-manno-octulosonic acid kinase
MALARVETNEGAILYDPRRIELPGSADFEPQALAASGRVVGTATGRGQVWFLAARSPGASAEQWVLRHYRRGGLVARLSPDRYLWTGEARTRSFAELRILDYLAARGLDVPAPVAASYRRDGLLYRADLLTVAIPGVTTLAALCAGAGSAGVEHGVAVAVGRSVRRLHDQGVWHADLNAHNVLLDARERAWLIDFDRARLRPAGAWAAQNLARLHRSLDKVHAARGVPLPGSTWRAIEAGYEGV